MPARSLVRWMLCSVLFGISAPVAATSAPFDGQDFCRGWQCAILSREAPDAFGFRAWAVVGLNFAANVTGVTVTLVDVADGSIAGRIYQGSSDADGFFRIVAPTYRSIDTVTGQAGDWLERFPLLCGHTYQALVEEPNTDEPTYSNLLEVTGC